MNILFILLTIFIIIIIYYIYFKNIEKFQINVCPVFCDYYNKQKFIYDLYTNINNNLTTIITDLNKLQDKSLRNVGSSLNNINKLIKNLLPTVTKNYNSASSNVTIYKCKCQTIELFESNKSPEIFTAITASDNIFLSMLYLRANVQIYSKAAKDIDLLVSTCIGISNSIIILINNITSSSVTSIIGNNFTALTTSLNTANNGVIDNIKYGDNLIKTYTNNIIKIICTITNDPTYVTTINSMNDSRKTNFINSFIDILKINVVNIPKMNNQKINEFNNTILINIGITKDNIFNQNSDFNKKNCNKNLIITKK
jgi:hypothetical protein